MSTASPTTGTGVSIVASDHSADGSGALEQYGVDYMEDFASGSG